MNDTNFCINVMLMQTLALYACIQLKSDVTRRYIHYQKLPEPPTVTEVFRWVCGTILIHSEMEEHQTPHSE